MIFNCFEATMRFFSVKKRHIKGYMHGRRREKFIVENKYIGDHQDLTLFFSHLE